MESFNIHMIIEGCLVNNHQARELLFQQVFCIGHPIAKQYAGTEANVRCILEKAYLYILDNLNFFDNTKLAFKSWVRQVIIDQGLESDTPIYQAVYNLRVSEGFNDADISKRLQISRNEVEQYYQEAIRQGAFIPDNKPTAEPEAMARAWETIAPIVEARYSTDEYAAMPLRATSKQHINNGGWIGWAVLIALSSIALVALGSTGLIKGNKIKVTQPSITHLEAGIGYSLPCPNH